jgi:hypothetical protein
VYASALCQPVVMWLHVRPRCVAPELGPVRGSCADGALTGLNKKETVAKFGDDQVKKWRRSYAIPPPEISTESEYWPGNDNKCASTASCPLRPCPCARHVHVSRTRHPSHASLHPSHASLHPLTGSPCVAAVQVRTHPDGRDPAR